MADKPTHLDDTGAARMVDVSAKDATSRDATAIAFVRFGVDAFEAIRAGDSKKGDVLGTARLAGIMGAKRTGDLVPLCHPIALTHVDVEFAWLLDESTLAIRCTARCVGQTGVEMEALAAAMIAALTVYDMTKGIDRSVVVTDVHVASKTGGKSGDWRHPAPPGPSLHGVTWQ